MKTTKCVLLLSLAAALCIGDAKAASIMPMGDSITVGIDFQTNAQGGYRDPLQTSLVSAGVSFSFVGVATNHPTTALTTAGNQYHNGYSGYRIDQLTGNLSANGGQSSNLGGFWITGGGGTGRGSQLPDVLLLHIGGNDINGNYDPQTPSPTDAQFAADMGQRLTNLITAFHTLSPSTTIMVASIIPVNTSTTALARTRLFNTYIQNTLVPSLPYTHFVDQYAGFVNADGSVKAGYLGADNLHPTVTGYQTMAAAWKPAIMAYLTGSGSNSPPAAPTGLNATAGNRQVALNWNAVSGATSYTAKVGLSSGGPYVTEATVSQTTYTDTSLTNGTTYYYVVTAGNSAGESGNSNQASATPSAGGGGSTVFANASFETPATGSYVLNPTGATWTFTGHGGIQHNGSAYSGTTAVAPDGIQTAFLQSSGTTGAMSQSVNFATSGTYSITLKAARRYNSVQPVQVKVDSTVVGTYTPSSNSFETITTAAFNVTAGSHAISFVASDTTGDKTTFIDLVSLTGGGGGGSAPAAPTGLTATAGNAQVGLSWAASSGATSYNVYHGTSVGGESATPIATGITGTAYTNTGLTNGTTHYYKVAAVNASGTSGYSNEASATPVSGGGTATFANASFETPAVGSYSLTPAGSSWTFTGIAGIQHNGSAYSGTDAVAPDGVQTAFLQGNGGTLGAMSQTLNITAAGSYTISFKAARRWGSIQPVLMKVDGTAVGTYTPVSGTFQTLTSAPFTVTTGNHIFSFEATDNTGDKTTFIDVMSITGN